MSVKGELDKIEKSLSSDPEIIIIFESLDHRGLYRVQGREDYGLLSLDEIEKRFEGENADIIRVLYVDDWRGSSCIQ